MLVIKGALVSHIITSRERAQYFTTGLGSCRVYPSFARVGTLNVPDNAAIPLLDVENSNSRIPIEVFSKHPLMIKVLRSGVNLVR